MDSGPTIWLAGLPGGGQEDLAVALRRALDDRSYRAQVVTAQRTDDPADVVVHLTTPKWVCVERDPTGDWARALQGELRGFPGVDRAYVPPPHVDHTADLHTESVESAAQRLAELLTATVVKR